MGVERLFPFIKQKVKGVPVERKISHYKGKTVAIDASQAIYAWCAIGASRGIKNSRGQYINHVQGLIYKTLKLLEHDMVPVYVFDGKPPIEKGATIAARRTAPNRVKVPGEVFEDCKVLLSLLGIPWIQAPSEAEAQAAALTNQVDDFGIPIVDAVMGEDSDTLVFGGKYLIRAGDNIDNVKEYSLDAILAGLSITHDKFISLCVMAGTDYNKGMFTLANAYKLITTASPTVDPAIKRLFVSPEIKVYKQRFGRTPVDVVGVEKYLNGHDLDPKKIKNILARLGALR